MVVMPVVPPVLLGERGRYSFFSSVAFFTVVAVLGSHGSAGVLWCGLLMGHVLRTQKASGMVAVWGLARGSDGAIFGGAQLLSFGRSGGGSVGARGGVSVFRRGGVRVGRSFVFSEFRFLWYLSDESGVSLSQ